MAESEQQLPDSSDPEKKHRESPRFLVTAQIPQVSPPEEILSGGFLAGALSGLVMALVAGLACISAGMSFWYPMRLVGALFFGSGALTGGPAVVIAGICTHLILSAAIGLIFAFIVDRRTPLAIAFVTGLVFSAIVWAMMTFVALPLFNPVMRLQVSYNAGWWFLLHMIYGAILSSTPSLKRRYAARYPEEAPQISKRAA